jgi:hypothetical protein
MGLCHRPSHVAARWHDVAVDLPKDTSVIAGALPLMMAMKRLDVVGSIVGTLKGA